MGELLPKQRAEAAKRGWQAVAGWGVTGVMVWKAGFFLGLVGIAVSVWLTLRWFKYRASWGMRF